MPFSLQTHERRGDKIVRVRPYLRISHRGGPILYLQEGHVYTESGERADPLPDWFLEELKRIDSKALVAVGFPASGEVKKRGRPTKAEQAARKVRIAQRAAAKVEESDTESVAASSEDGEVVSDGGSGS